MVLVNNEVRRDMWRFVHDNAVYPGTMPDGDTIVQVNLSFDREAYSRRQGGDIEYTEVTVAHDGDFVRFYYLPWRAEACFTGRIPRGGPNYFFTGPLNGCTVGVDRNWYNPTVGHANYSDPQAEDMDPGRMRAELDHRMAASRSMFSRAGSGPTLTVVESHDRRNIYGRDVNYNVFGYRGWLGWWFMYQVVDRNEQRRRPVHTASIYTLF
jgi:hypothetical protein